MLLMPGTEGRFITDIERRKAGAARLLLLSWIVENSFTKTNYCIFAQLKIWRIFGAQGAAKAQNETSRKVDNTYTKVSKIPIYKKIEYDKKREHHIYESVGRGFESLPAYQSRIIRTLSQ